MRFLIGALLFFLKYCLVGFLQQYALNGFLANRLALFWGSEKDDRVALTAAYIFGIVHLPNWFLMVVTSVGGYFCVKIFLKYRNLYFLGLAHAVIGVLLFYAVPENITHHFATGIKYFTFDY